MSDSNKSRAIFLIESAFKKYGDGDKRKLAYILATADHESKFTPSRECFAKDDKSARECVKNRSYGKEINGNVYYGRGLVQLTWYSNYKRVGDIIGENLVENPDLALDLKISSKIIVIGMMFGVFTGISLKTYINESFVDFENSRRVVNGQDRAKIIANMAEQYLAGLL